MLMRVADYDTATDATTSLNGFYFGKLGYRVRVADDAARQCRYYAIVINVLAVVVLTVRERTAVSTFS